MDDMCIHSHATMPPTLMAAPCDDRGLTGNYWPATREGAIAALDYHHRVWSDYAVDGRIVAMAE